MNSVSAKSATPRTSSILTLTAFISSSAAVTAACRGDAASCFLRREGRVGRIMFWAGPPVQVSGLAGSIAPALTNDPTNFIGHQIAWIVPGDEGLPQLRRGDLQ